MGTSAPVSPPRNEWDAEDIKDWFVQHGRRLAIGASVAAVVAAVWIFGRQSARLKSDRAEAAYITAQSAYYSGNQTLAKTELEKILTRYPKTAGAAQAGMLLAQVLYGEGKHDEGITRLSDLRASVPDQFGAAVEELIGAGYADSRRAAQAADHYMQASQKARFAADKDVYRAEAARLLAAAGRTAEAQAVWQELAENPESPVVNEAKIRLGELTAKPAIP